MANKGNKDSLTFLDHLEELRWHIIRCLIAVVVIMIAVFAMGQWLFDTVILAPTMSNFISYKVLCQLSEQFQLGDALCFKSITYSIQSIKVQSQFLTHLKIAFTLGFVVASPYIFWEFWRFVKPGLKLNEIKKSRGFAFICSLLFLLGVCFGYFILAPFSLNFLGNYQVSERVMNEFTLQSVIAIISMICLATGLVFQLPVLAFLLARLGLITPSLMKKYRKHAYIVTLVLSAMITPPDVTSQILIGIPIAILYEISIVICRRVERRMAKEAA